MVPKLGEERLPQFPTPATLRKELAQLLRELASPGGQITQWSKQALHRLDDFNVQVEIGRLAEDGVAAETIAIAQVIFDFASALDQTLQSLGNRRRRQQTARALLSTLPSLKVLAASMGGHDSRTPPTATDIYNPAVAARSLESYAGLINFDRWLNSALSFGSFESFVKYCFAVAVKAITGKYHDPEVSALTGAILRRQNEDETSYRVWRIRTFKKKRPEVALYLPALLEAINDAMRPNAVNPAQRT